MTKLTWLTARCRGISPQQLLDEFNINKAPINPFTISRALGLEVYNLPIEKNKTDEALDGMLEICDEHIANIFINQTKTVTRQRFAVAHIIGVLLYYPLKVSRSVKLSKTNISHLIPNTFACELLMPSHFISAYLHVATPYELHTVFQVTPEVMKLRMKSLGYLITQQIYYKQTPGGICEKF